MILRAVPLIVLTVLAACNAPGNPDTEPSAGAAPSTAAPAATATSASGAPSGNAGEPPPAAASVDPAARRIALTEWRKSDQPQNCAPLALTSDAGARGTARRANFSGGWGVAFDQPGLRSAYGFAGTGYLPQHTDSPTRQRARLAAQWPLVRDLEHLPKPSFAGYGIEGAKAYSSSNPEGRGENSIAYVRIGGQQCDYNVWTKLGRAHLEHLLDHLEMLPTG